MNNLAVSYHKLGTLYIVMKQKNKAKKYFLETKKILKKVVKISPIPEYQNNLKEVQDDLEKL